MEKDTAGDPLIKRIGSLEIDQDLQAQKRLWRIQKWGRSFCALLLLTALTGLFGRGPLSHHQISDSRQLLSMEYERFAYRDTEDNISFRIRKNGDQKSSLWINNDYLAAVRLKDINPEPRSVSYHGNKTFFEFDLQDTTEAFVTLNFQSSHAGFRKGQVGLAEGPELSFWQFFWP